MKPEVQTGHEAPGRLSLGARSPWQQEEGEAMFPEQMSDRFAQHRDLF